MVNPPLGTSSRANRVRDSKRGGERNSARSTCGGNPVRLEVLGTRAGRTSDALGNRIVHRDGQSRRHVRHARPGGGEGLRENPVGVDDDGHRLGKLGAAGCDRRVDEAHSARNNHVTDRELGSHVRTAGADEHDGPRSQLGDMHGGTDRGRGQSDAYRTGGDEECAGPGGHGVAERLPKGGEFRVKRSNDEDVRGRGHRDSECRTTRVPIGPDERWLPVLAYDGAADYP
jgi:hypothetical protein